MPPQNHERCALRAVGTPGFQLRQGTDRSLGDPGDPADGGCAQGDHYGGRFLVIEQKGRRRRAHAEPVAACHASDAMHGVAQGAQTLDVAAAVYVPSLRGAQPARRRRACHLRDTFPQPLTRVTIVT